MNILLGFTEFDILKFYEYVLLRKMLFAILQQHVTWYYLTWRYLVSVDVEHLAFINVLVWQLLWKLTNYFWTYWISSRTIRSPLVYVIITTKKLILFLVYAFLKRIAFFKLASEVCSSLSIYLFASYAPVMLPYLFPVSGYWTFGHIIQNRFYFCVYEQNKSLLYVHRRHALIWRATASASWWYTFTWRSPLQHH